MAPAFVLPFENKDSVKNIVFSILVSDYPLKTIELTNYVRRRYGKLVSFQAVRKAALELVDDGVIVKEKGRFSISKQWVLEGKRTFDSLYADLSKEKNAPKAIQSITGDVSVFSFDSVNEMMKFWQELIDDWLKKFRSGDYAVNCYQAAHVWEVLLHLEKEEKIMGQMKRKGITPYALIKSDTRLDRNVERFYRKIGVKTRIKKSAARSDKGYYVGTYGDLVINATYPAQVVRELDRFFSTNTSLVGLDISELLRIVKQDVPVKLTVIKNLELAKQINGSIIAQVTKKR
jgi:hypothetical protein